jgi:Spy/CpxP family protein refolding chaperone
MKNLLLVSLLLGLVFNANAQGKPGAPKPDQKPQEKMHREFLMKSLDLSPEQQEQFKKLREEHRAQSQKLHEQQKADFEKILTPEQKKKIADLKSLGKVKMENRAAERAQLMKIELGLSEERAALLEKQRKLTAEKLKALHENKSLEAEKKREQSKAIMKEHEEFLKANLTAEQFSKLKSMRQMGLKAKKDQFQQRRQQPE